MGLLYHILYYRIFLLVNLVCHCTRHHRKCPHGIDPDAAVGDTAGVGWRCETDVVALFVLEEDEGRTRMDPIRLAAAVPAELKQTRFSSRRRWTGWRGYCSHCGNIAYFHYLGFLLCFCRFLWYLFTETLKIQFQYTGNCSYYFSFFGSN